MALNAVVTPARQILELLKSHVEGDDDRFRTAALQLAANEARQGHDDIAQQIKHLVEQSQQPPRLEDRPQAVNSVPFFRPQGELAGLLEKVQIGRASCPSRR